MPSALPFNDTIGQTVPPDTPHAVSVSLATWESNVAYEEGETWVLEKMQTGYPRFFVHKTIDRLATTISSTYGRAGDRAMLFPSPATAQRCVTFMRGQLPDLHPSEIRILRFVPSLHKDTDETQYVLPRICAVLYPKEHVPVAKQVWQHTGEGVSSRRAEFCERALQDGSMVEESSLEPASRMRKGPRRYQRQTSREEKITNGNATENGVAGGEGRDPSVFVEERFGRNLNVALASKAKLAIRRRIAGSLSSDVDLHEALDASEERTQSRNVEGFSVDDVYLFPNGMNAIYTAHRTLMLARTPRKSISYGFPYVDTLKIIQKWGPGALFYGHGSQEDLDDLERRLEAGERFLAFFCEFPGNPLLTSPNLQRIRALGDKYDFALVVDETIGNLLNVHVLPYADVVVSSLTKIFSGDSNVMGGSMILNPKGQYYNALKTVLATEQEDNVFEEDAIFLERNSRDFVSRSARVNTNAETICGLLLSHPRVKQVNYPKFSATRKYYDACRLPNGGYGGLLSCTFHSTEDAKTFYDHLDTHKGPSLGTNFTLASPYVILAHYQELEWAAEYGAEASLIRMSVGLEDTEFLMRIFQQALDAAVEARP